MGEQKHVGGLISERVFESFHIPEPSLMFGTGSRHPDPKAGLEQYGPLLTSGQKIPSPLTIRVGVVGTGETVSTAKHFMRLLESGVSVHSKNPFQDPPFPGFKSIFRCEMLVLDTLVKTIPQSEVDQISEHAVFEDKVEYATNLFVDRIKLLSEMTPHPDVVLCALPQKIVGNCSRPA